MTQPLSHGGSITGLRRGPCLERSSDILVIDGAHASCRLILSAMSRVFDVPVSKVQMSSVRLFL